MKWIARIPTHDNNGKLFPRRVLNAILLMVRQKFGGYSLDGPGEGAWTDNAGRVYRETSYILSVVCDRQSYLEARQIVKVIGKQLKQKAMYFEVWDLDGVEILEIE